MFYTPRNFYFASQYHIIINSNKWKSYEFYFILYINVYNEKGMERIFMQRKHNPILVFRIILWYYGFHIYLNENATKFLLSWINVAKHKRSMIHDRHIWSAIYVTKLWLAIVIQQVNWLEATWQNKINIFLPSKLISFFFLWRKYVDAFRRSLILSIFQGFQRR